MNIDGKEVKYLYMAVTKDKYELPIAVADSTKELAIMLGLPHKTVSMYMCKSMQGRGGFRKVYVGDDMDEI